MSDLGLECDFTLPKPKPIPGKVLSFSGEESPDYLRKSANLLAAQWFVSRGYMASIPIDAVAYDLVVESDDGFQRVQVKSTTSRNDQGVWTVGVSRTGYRKAGDSRGAAIIRRAYTDNDADLFFIVCGDWSCYLIPAAQVIGKQVLNLNNVYANFLVTSKRP